MLWHPCNTVCETGYPWFHSNSLLSSTLDMLEVVLIRYCYRCAQPTPGSISRAALDGSDPLALEAVDMFLAILGCEAGFMGLRLLATGGVYICGGIGPKVTTIRDAQHCLLPFRFGACSVTACHRF